jgi:RND family efflux transporter MFP subunit
VERAKADIAKAKADAANWTAQTARDKAELVRVRESLKKGVGIAADEDKALASVGVDEAQIDYAKASEKAAVANLAKADENKKYTVIYAPTTGRIGQSKVADQSVVTAYQTEMVEVYPIDPIYAFFDVDELTSLWYREQIYITKSIPDPRKTPLRCWIRLKSEDKYTRESTVDFIDPIINRNTGTRTVRATFQNKDGRLSSGDSVRVQVEAGPPAQVLMIPERAVMSAQRDRFVFVVNGDGVAEARPVELGDAVDGMVIVEKGLAEQDRVVTTNMLRVRPGVKVVVQGEK